MSRSRRKSAERKINPHFWVFCEGQTEEAYIKHLRSQYRIPIEIVPKIVGNKITERFIKNYKKDKPQHPKDKDFLVYDADVKSILEKLQKIKTAILIASNPSTELWFLLHYKNQKAAISSDDCSRELSNRNRNSYKKGYIDKELEVKLIKKRNDACKRAKQTKHFSNPSTNFHVFIQELNKVKRKNNCNQ